MCVFFGINLNDIKYFTKKATRTINDIMTDLYVLKAVYLYKFKSNITQSAHV